MEAGRANGINSVAVATGHYDTEKLKSLGPTFVFEDLSDTERGVGRVARLGGCGISRMQRLVLFDVDLTLIATTGCNLLATEQRLRAAPQYTRRL